MPPAEVELAVAQVEALVAGQAPGLSGPITPLAHGWDNFLFRVGEEWLARFPRREVAVPLVGNEVRWLPELAPHLPLPIPVPMVAGEPGEGFPWPWTIVPWIDGVPAAETSKLDLGQAATELGAFLRALHVVAPAGAPANPYRGVPLAQRDEAVRQRIASLDALIDVDEVQTTWEDALDAPKHQGAPVWLHGDLHPRNVVVSGTRISGIVDFGDITSGDPATDLAVMWTVLGGEHHHRFTQGYGDIGRHTRRRARGWALVFALAFLAFSADNPAMERIGRRTLAAVLAEPRFDAPLAT